MTVLVNLMMQGTAKFKKLRSPILFCDVNGKATKREGALEFWQKMGFESANCYLKCPNFCPIPTKANKAKVKRIQELAPVVEQGVVELSEHFQRETLDGQETHNDEGMTLLCMPHRHMDEMEVKLVSPKRRKEAPESASTKGKPRQLGLDMMVASDLQVLADLKLQSKLAPPKPDKMDADNGEKKPPMKSVEVPPPTGEPLGAPPKPPASLPLTKKTLHANTTSAGNPGGDDSDDSTDSEDSSKHPDENAAGKSPESDGSSDKSQDAGDEPPDAGNEPTGNTNDNPTDNDPTDNNSTSSGNQGNEANPPNQSNEESKEEGSNNAPGGQNNGDSNNNSNQDDDSQSQGNDDDDNDDNDDEKEEFEDDTPKSKPSKIKKRVLPCRC